MPGPGEGTGELSIDAQGCGGQGSSLFVGVLEGE